MYDFTTVLERDSYGSLIRFFTPDALKKAGIVSFRAAEMDFPTAPSVTAAVVEMAQQGRFGFTLQDARYNEHVIWWMGQVRNWRIESDWIVPVHGTIFALATAIRLLVGPEDRIIVQPPYYDRYKQAADRLHRGTVFNNMKRTGDRFTVDFDGLERLMQDPRNRLLVLCNPNNPTGQVLSRDELQRIAELSERYGVYVFSDEIFADIVLEGGPVTPYASLETGRRYAITATSLGKTFSMTGVNHANVFIPDGELRERYIARRYADHYGSIEPCYYAATLGGYSPEGLDWVKAMTEVVRKNSGLVHRTFEQYLPQFRVLENPAGFTCFIDFRSLGLTGDALQDELTERAMFHLDPDTDYGPGMEGYARMSLGSTYEQTAAAMERMRAAYGR